MKVVSVVFCAMALQMSGQTIEGDVRDSSGLAIPRAVIEVRKQERVLQRREADERGAFRIVVSEGGGGLTIHVSASGFLDQEVPVKVGAGAPTSVSITLLPRPVNQSVTVSERLDGYAVATESTATRMGISLMNLPLSVSVIHKNVIADQAAVNVSEALRNASGVRQTGTYFGTYDRLNLRGFDQSQTNTYYRNGARFTMLSNVNAASLEQVEVLKGPASIMFGQITPGGAVNLVTKRPREDHRAEVMFRRGSFNTTDGIVDFTGPMWKSKGLFYRVNFYGRHGDSFRDFVNNDQALINPSLTWRPRESTTLRLEGEYDRFFSLVDLGLVAADGRTFSAVERLPLSRFLGEPGADFRSLKRFASADLDHKLSSIWRVRGAYNYHYMHRDVKQIAGVSMAADQETFNRRTNAFLQHYRNYFVQGDLLGNFSTGAARHTLMVGGDSLLTRPNGTRNSLSTAAPINIFRPIYGGLANFVYSRNFNSKNKQTGYYAQDQVAFRNGLQFLLGVRHNRVEDFENGNKDHDWSPRLGAIYRPRSWVSLYGSFSQSFEVVNGFDFTNNRFVPSLGRQMEFGVKNRLLGDKLNTTLAWFRLRRTNVVTADPIHPGFSIQTGLQQSQGLEFEAQGSLTASWRVIGAYTYLDTAILADNRIPIGNQFGGAPRNSASIWSNHSFSGPLRRLGAGWGVFYTGSVFGNVQNAYRVPGYATVDAHLSYGLFERTRLQLNLKNILNERFYVAGSNLLGIFPGAPRSFAASITTNF